MKRIYKYKLEAQELNVLSLPKGYEILKVAEQHGDIYAWVLHDLRNTYEPVNIYSVPTGVDLRSDLDLSYLDTVFLYNSNLVFHFFTDHFRHPSPESFIPTKKEEPVDSRKEALITALKKEREILKGRISQSRISQYEHAFVYLRTGTKHPNPPKDWEVYEGCVEDLEMMFHDYLT